jgi:hypothetical protein
LIDFSCGFLVIPLILQSGSHFIVEFT